MGGIHLGGGRVAGCPADSGLKNTLVEVRVIVNSQYSLFSNDTWQYCLLYSCLYENASRSAKILVETELGKRYNSMRWYTH